jgi:2-dehydropantoate 2-reductase
MFGSTLQSLRRGRPTEIDYLNGEVVALGRRVDVPTPVNIAIVELVHQVERTGRFLPTDEIRRVIESADRAASC